MDIERTIEFILEQHAKTEAGLAKTEAGLAKTEAILNRAIRLGIREARAERRKRQELASEFDRKMTQLAAAQLVTEERLQSLIRSMERGRNGHS